MAIKNQCETCARLYSTACPGGLFDGTPCPVFATKTAAAQEHTTAAQGHTPPSSHQSPTPEITAQHLKQTTRIKGELRFCLGLLMFGGIIIFAASLISFYWGNSERNPVLVLSDVILGLMFLALSAYILYSFVERKSDAVFLAYTYFVARFVYNLLTYIADNTGEISTKSLLSSLMWTVMWLAYLAKSKQVIEVIPPSYRKVTRKDYGIVAALVLVPFLCSAASEIWLSARQPVEFPPIEATSPAGTSSPAETSSPDADEYSDGLVTFVCPSGYTCGKRTTDDNMTLHLMTNDEGSALSVISCIEKNSSKEFFEQAWRQAKDNLKYEVIPYSESKAKTTINGDMYREKVSQVDMNGTDRVWHCVVVYHRPTSIFCVVNFYHSMDAENILTDFLNGIRFE